MICNECSKREAVHTNGMCQYCWEEYTSAENWWHEVYGEVYRESNMLARGWAQAACINPLVLGSRFKHNLLPEGAA